MEIVKIRKSRSSKSSNTSFNAIYHVAALVPKENDLKPAFQYIYSTGEEIISTDGRSLHKAKIEMTKGFYMVVVCTNRLVVLHYEGETVENIMFPDHESVTPKNYESYPKIEINFNFSSTGYNVLGEAGRAKAYTRIIRHITEKGITIDFNKLRTFTGQWDFYCEHKEVNPGDVLRPFVFVSKDKLCFALIMPLQIRE